MFRKPTNQTFVFKNQIGDSSLISEMKSYIFDAIFQSPIALVRSAGGTVWHNRTTNDFKLKWLGGRGMWDFNDPVFLSPFGIFTFFDNDAENGPIINELSTKLKAAGFECHIIIDPLNPKATNISFDAKQAGRVVCIEKALSNYTSIDIALIHDEKKLAAIFTPEHHDKFVKTLDRLKTADAERRAKITP